MDVIPSDTQSSTPMSTWQITPGRVIHADRPLCIGILNITPDSFADGGQLGSVAAALDRAMAFVDQGADGLDIGGESTRPGAERIASQEQISRVVPVISAIRNAGIGVPISIDTTSAAVALAALDSGADAINDVSAGIEDDEMLALAGDRRCGIILMHRAVPPKRDRYSDQYDHPPISGCIVDHVVRFLQTRRDAAIGAGIEPAGIMLDPGLGFGKDVGQNLELIRGTDRLIQLGHPVLSALSRKSFVGRVSLGKDSDPDERLAGTLALSTLHLVEGARFFRVHDVGAHRQALDAAWALLNA